MAQHRCHSQPDWQHAVAGNTALVKLIDDIQNSLAVSQGLHR